MLDIHKAHKIQQLLALVEAQAHPASAAPDVGALRVQIGRILDANGLEQQLPRGQRVSILMSDLRGFMAMAEKHSALDMMEALNRYLGRMSEIIIRHGGAIDKFMGDGIMAVFGAPKLPDDGVAAALASAVEMQLAMDEINAENQRCGMTPLYMGIGINTGEAVLGWLGSALHREYTVIGDQVNLASRVEAHSLRGQILLSEGTYALARDFIETGHVNEVRIKGRQGVIRLYELLATHRPLTLNVPRREIRNGPRVEVDMPLTFQLLRGKSIVPTELHARVCDISYGGMRIVTEVVFPLLAEIRIGLSLSLLGGEMTEIYAKAFATAVVSGGHEYRLEFTAIAPPAALAIKEFVDQLLELS